MLVRLDCHLVLKSFLSSASSAVAHWLCWPSLPRAPAVQFCYRSLGFPALGVGPCAASTCPVLQNSFHNVRKQMVFPQCAFECVDLDEKPLQTWLRKKYMHKVVCCCVPGR